ncbi:pyrroline-5-carboxylate reductase dimerization domain-containing protein [Conexibacter stalactiti]|uniref:Pyrroline-5-carboxylate reductase n=1 Tax=Conexibacter stalactiti TaxID=1940611 RepID=A0ABU4I008_9ACTN|nr:pyrroline-5-carboxylate reductase dimerization domain-containing protein [Conexibacter stalactiti]MDW5598768.1 pyrroline-5-carboxylate reductase dimerization domain-containing protein [Conexibacter stalactiti]MEC5039410.1 pyrroline-5-carboxylate reductase dimerization domain-containing protein [Conexibacter stalactiti]
MQVGLIGAGNMASAFARGWGDPLLVTDVDFARAEALAAELGGEAVVSNAELAQRADVVFLCHKPYQLDEVAAEAAGTGAAIVSILGGVPLEALQAAYPGQQVFRLMPNVNVAVSRGVIVLAEPADADRELLDRLLGLLGRVGTVVRLPDRLIDAATAAMGVGPAYTALYVEAQVDAIVRLGIPADVATELVTATVGGTIELLAARDNDTLAVRRSVTSPAGSTARGLAALERNGIRTAFDEAADAVVHGGRA